MTKRQVVDSLRNKLREVSADSTYSTQFLYNSLKEQARWLIKREIAKGTIYKNSSFFQTLGCLIIDEVSTIDPCCPITTCNRIFRTREKLPDIWVDDKGPVIKSINSVDNTTTFFLTSTFTWQAKSQDPYQKKYNARYSFYRDGYLWFPEDNPHYINLYAFFTDDITNLDSCKEKKDCVQFLNTRFMLPDWLEAEMYAKALEQLAGITKKLPEDNQIDKNTNHK